MESNGPQHQGKQFEESFRELIARILNKDLGFTIVENRLQSAGAQYGKDVQTRWRDENGSEIFWQFECKSHSTRPLASKEVADKLFDLARSSHEVDVWCLTLANVEVGQWIDEILPWARKHLDLPFGIEVLSPGRNDIKGLFACWPDLGRLQYSAGELPDLDPAQREKVISTFASFLRGATEQARTEGASPWQFIAPSRMTAVDDPAMAAAYLRGLGPTAPWAAVTHSWATWRRSSIEGVLTRILGMNPGFDFAWLVGPGGEGKSTLMKQIAWTVAARLDGWFVFWTDPTVRDGKAEFPIKIIEGLANDAKVLLCVDGSTGLGGAQLLRNAVAGLTEAGKHIFVLIADRGVDMRRSSLLSPLRRGLPQADRVIELAPLSEEEAKELVATLADRDLLHFPVSEAQEILTRRDAANIGTGPWLLPTVMQLTDPQGRGFEEILASVIDGLDEDKSAGPLLLLLAASLVQAAGGLLPRELGERLVEEEGGFISSMDTLTAELESRLSISRETMTLIDLTGVLVTHHRVIAEGFVNAAAKNREHRARLLDTCDGLPASVAKDIDEVDLIPPERFELLNRSVLLLRGLYPPQFELADRFLRSMVALDNRQFPALTRLAECDTAWLRDEIRRGGDEDLLQWLEGNARHAFRSALRTAQDVLEAPLNRQPRPYRHYKPEEQEQFICHPWGVLEDTIGERKKETASLKRAVMLFLLNGNLLGISTLTIPLQHMRELERAAQASAAFRAIAPQKESELKRVRKQEQALRKLNTKLPEVGVEVLDVLVPDLIENVVPATAWREIDLFESRNAHLAALERILVRASRHLDRHDLIDKTMELLAATKPGPNAL